MAKTPFEQQMKALNHINPVEHKKKPVLLGNQGDALSRHCRRTTLSRHPEDAVSFIRRIEKVIPQTGKSLSLTTQTFTDLWDRVFDPSHKRQDVLRMTSPGYDTVFDYVFKVVILSPFVLLRGEGSKP
jgi:hypothetical protein